MHQDYDRWDALLHHIFKQTQGDAWFRPQEDHLTSGVAIRINDDDPPEFRVFPYENASLEPFEAAVCLLNPVVAVKVRSAAVHAALSQLDPSEQSLYIDANTRIQVLETMLDLAHADKEQRAAFIRDERVLVVWSSSLDNIIPTCQDFDERLIKLLWRSRPVASNASVLSSISTPNSNTGHDSQPSDTMARSLVQEVDSTPSSTPPVSLAPISAPPTVRKRTWYGRVIEVPATASDSPPPRPTLVYAPIYNGLAAGLAIVFIGNGIRILLWEFFMDGSFFHFVLCAALPLLYCVSLFFALQIIQNVTMAFGPIAHYHRNSKYYSAIPPPPIPTTTSPHMQSKELLPHITIQMPVYKESLEKVLKPSIVSLKAAMRTYALQGGTSSLFVFDDGLRASGMTTEERNERIRFYRDEDIGWCARPREGCPATGVQPDFGQGLSDPEKGRKKSSKAKPNSETFHRPGRFKKASNMNYGLSLSLCVERWLEVLLREREDGKRQAPPTAPAPSLKQLVGEERRISKFGYPPMSPTSTRGRKATMSSYGLQYLNYDGDDMATDVSSSNTPGSQRVSIYSPTPRSPFAPLLSSPYSENAPTPTSGTPTTDTPTPTPPEDIEEQALQLAIEDMYSQSGEKWKPWAANARAMRIGEIVLLVDSDTEVPEDCLRDAAREMYHSPALAIIQHESDVMQVAHHYFENGIAYFTRRVNKCIGISCANGEVAPFVGHNAFLRWRAIQDAALQDNDEGKKVEKDRSLHETNTKIWSESNVSEDFDMALRLIRKGYTVRWATYSNGSFKEGVSLTVDDELNRWMKYAYGCNELLFNPLWQWIYKGPISKQIHTFVWSNAPLHYKFSVLSYMFSYYGIAASLLISLINYVLLAFQFPVDGFYMHSWEVWLAVTVVFLGSGTVAYTLLRYRLGEKSLLSAFLENLIWIPFFPQVGVEALKEPGVGRFFFFGGLSISLSQSILAHLFSVNITWSATKKEVERSNFFKEIPRIARRFWFPFVIAIIILAGMVIATTSLVPIEWRVGADAWAVIFPLAVVCSCHILFPIVLNPWLMVFSY